MKKGREKGRESGRGRQSLQTLSLLLAHTVYACKVESEWLAGDSQTDWLW